MPSRPALAPALVAPRSRSQSAAHRRRRQAAALAFPIRDRAMHSPRNASARSVAFAHFLDQALDRLSRVTPSEFSDFGYAAGTAAGIAGLAWSPCPFVWRDVTRFDPVLRKRNDEGSPNSIPIRIFLIDIVGNTVHAAPSSGCDTKGEVLISSRYSRLGACLTRRASDQTASSCRAVPRIAETTGREETRGFNPSPEEVL